MISSIGDCILCIARCATKIMTNHQKSCDKFTQFVPTPNSDNIIILLSILLIWIIGLSFRSYIIFDFTKVSYFEWCNTRKWFVRWYFQHTPFYQTMKNSILFWIDKLLHSIWAHRANAIKWKQNSKFVGRGASIFIWTCVWINRIQKNNVHKLMLKLHLNAKCAQTQKSYILQSTSNIQRYLPFRSREMVWSFLVRKLNNWWHWITGYQQPVFGSA